MLDAHCSVVVESAYAAKERTPLIRLDAVAKDYLSADSRPFVKIDAQRFEW